MNLTMKLLSVIALTLLLSVAVQASEGGLRRRRDSHQQRDGRLPVGLQKLRQRRRKAQGKQLQEPQVQTERQTAETTETAEAEKETRIIGGQNAPAGKYPFMADFDLGCGASLISTNMLLTAAHCLELVRASEFAYIGSNQVMKGMKRKVESVFVHPRYNSKSTAYDFLLVKLKDPVTTIKPVSLNSDATVPGLQTISKTNGAQRNNNNNASTKQVAGELMTVIGFGVTREGATTVSNVLQEARVPYVPHETCRKWYKNEELDEVSMFCGGFEEGGVDSCQGDSGAPILSSKGVQIGVVSWGQGCARPKSPGVYSRVSTVLPWIYEMLCEHSPQKPSSYCIGSRDTVNSNSGNSGNNQSSNNNGNNNGSSASNPPPNQVNPKETGHTLQLDIKYDANPKQTAWVLVDSSNNKVLDSITYGDANIPNQELSLRYENQPSGNKYTFLISDSAGNGLTNAEEGRGSGGNGYVTISEILEDGSSQVLWANNGDFGPGTYKMFELPREDASSSSSRAAASPENANGWV